MDIEYTRILLRWENCRQLRFLLIGQYIEELRDWYKGVDWKDRYFSQLQVSLY